MEAEITKDGLKIGGKLVPPTSEGLEAAFGTPSFEHTIPAEGGAVRRIRLFNPPGCGYSFNDPGPEVPSVVFGFWPQDAPFQIESVFEGALRINDTVVMPDWTEANLPTGEFKFEPQYAQSWRANAETFSVWLTFRARQDAEGNRTGTPKLTGVLISYDPSRLRTAK